jgi:hypothetical protein
MSFLLGLFIGMGLSSKGSNRDDVGGIQFLTVEEAMSHKGSPDPFDAQDAFQQSFAPDSLKAGDSSLPESVRVENNLPAESG